MSGRFCWAIVRIAQGSGSGVRLVMTVRGRLMRVGRPPAGVAVMRIGGGGQPVRILVLICVAMAMTHRGAERVGMLMSATSLEVARLLPASQLVLRRGAKLESEQAVPSRRHVSGGNQRAHHERRESHAFRKRAESAAGDFLQSDERRDEQRRIQRLRAPVSSEAVHDSRSIVAVRIS